MLLSSIFKTHNASLANDGNTSTNGSLCSHTNVNQNIAWLQVDLGVPCSISNVKMFYREFGEFFHIERQLEIHSQNNHNINLVKIMLKIANRKLINFLSSDNV